ncbi:hypothetical protein F66182_1561 [Fusarium sp. NRRL 66182]|nr:hypothetical protein F66182_1561 [Fusarium sp. NRRL 66182]
MKAMVSNPSGGYSLSSDIPQPTLKPGTMLVRVHAVSLNPYDYKVIEYQASSSGVYIGGCDFAGVVVAIGADVTRFHPGDRVLSMNLQGGFAEYALSFEDLSCHVPEGMPFSQASAFGLGLGIAGLALFQEPGLNLTLPEGKVNLAATNGYTNGYTKAQDDRKKTSIAVLVAGGASASGTMATQLLKLSGFNPIVTCSPANNALCESFGASACFNYNSPTCGADIRLHTDNTLAYVLDCVANAATMKMCYEAIGIQGGTYIALEPTANTVKYTRRDVRADWVMANTLLGDPCALDGIYGRPSTPEHRQFASRLFELAERWLHEGKIQNHPVEIRTSGLQSVDAGLQDLRDGIVRGKKLVVALEVAA